MKFFPMGHVFKKKKVSCDYLPNNKNGAIGSVRICCLANHFSVCKVH